MKLNDISTDMFCDALSGFNLKLDSYEETEYLEIRFDSTIGKPDMHIKYYEGQRTEVAYFTFDVANPKGSFCMKTDSGDWEWYLSSKPNDKIIQLVNAIIGQESK